MDRFLGVSVRLIIMMFLQYFIVGSFNTTMGLVLSEAGLSSIIGIAYSLFGVAALISPLLVGMLADRFFASQKVMACLQVMSGIMLFLVPRQIEAGNSTAFLWLIFAIGVFYQPTTVLSNSISFHHIDGMKTFPVIRMCGTVGFLTAGIVVGQLGLSGSTTIFYFAAGASFLLGLYSLTLPNTPALSKGEPFAIRDLFFLDALKMFKDRYFLIFVIATIILFMPKSMYQSFIAVFLDEKHFDNVATIMQIGTVSEVLFMFLMPFILWRLGFKYMFLFGALAWLVRFSLFSFSATENVTTLIIIGIALHGVCWDFFFTTGDIYVDKKADVKIKAQALGLKRAIDAGFGTFIGSLIAGEIFNRSVTEKGVESLPQWQVFWLYPVFISLVAVVLFVFFFKDEFKKEKSSKKYEGENIMLEKKA
jgi:nucleoside transporter